jgi:hypothetical protein
VCVIEGATSRLLRRTESYHHGMDSSADRRMHAGRGTNFGRVTVLQGMSVQVIKRALEQQVAKQHTGKEAAQKIAAGAEAAPDEGSGSVDGAHGAGASASAAVAAEAAAPAPAVAASAQPRSSAGANSTSQDAEPQPQGCAEGTHQSPGSHSKLLSGVRTCRPAGCTLPTCCVACAFRDVAAGARCSTKL